jgi:Holliday junction DNA helicase RuvA
VPSTEVDGSLLVTVPLGSGGGVGYEVVAPLGTVGRAATDANGLVTLFIHTHVREDVFTLFGFATDDDRFAFRQLISVSSVGPKTAVAVLSALPAHELGRVIARKELGALTMISGIGKKTAERLVLELRDKIPEGPVGESGAAPLPRAAQKNAPSGKGGLLAQALINMGYKPAEAERAVAAVTAQPGSDTDTSVAAQTDLSALLREALKFLSK